MEVILHIGIAQFSFAGLLILSKRDKQLTDLLLGSWLLLMTIFMSLTLLKNEFPQKIWGQLQLFPFFFTIGPFLYLYVRTLVQESPNLKFGDSLHLLPFVIFSVAAVTLDAQVDEDVIAGNAFHLNRLFISVPALFSFATYIFLSLYQLNLHKKNLHNHFSYSSFRISLQWLRAVILLFVITLIFTIVSALVNVGTGRETINPGISLFLGITLFGFAVTFFGIRQPSIFHRAPDIRFIDLMEKEPGLQVPSAQPQAVPETVHPSPKKQNRYARSGLNQADFDAIKATLLAYFEREKPYLQRDLTIRDVADALSLPQHHLTQTINEGMGKNFYTLVNSYRVDEVKKRILDPQYAHLTVLAIAHDAGFNSKSTFNTTFKKYTGSTPSQYKKTFGG